MTASATLTIEADAPPTRELRAQRAPKVARVRVGAWVLGDELGRGGMATVYAATHKRFGKRAAVKLAHTDAIGPTFTADMFLREARVANRVDHPGVADVFAAGTTRGRPYLVMERLAGTTLGERAVAAPIAHGEAFALLAELAGVLGAAHAAGVTHRDLKLDNVFLLATPGVGGRRVKLLDWGVARIDGEDDPLRGMVAGTLTYVAPEQLRGEPVGPPADVYSLAVLAYRVLCGTAPFTAEDDRDLMKQHLRCEPPTPAALGCALPDALAALLVQMLAKDPAARPPIGDVERAFAAAAAAPAPPADPLGRPVLVVTSRAARLAGAVLGVLITAATVFGVISACS